MDNLIDDLVRAARRCDRAGKVFDKDPVESIHARLLEACQQVGLASSGSWLGYFANIYVEGLRPARPGEHFDTEWGGVGVFCSSSTGPWCEYSFEAVKTEILRRAGVEDYELLNEAAEQAGNAFEAAREDIIPALDAILSAKEDEILRGLRTTIVEMKNHFSAEQFAELVRPKGHFVTRDMMAATGGQRVPPHLQFQLWVMERYSWGQQAKELAKVTRQVVKYLQHKMKMKGNTVAKTEGTIFIGHGGSSVWRDLKDFIQDRLSLQWEEFNREPTAGHSTKERLEAMLDSACFAFLVMTAEDERADGTKQARANVIHEVGLFQGRLGFERAIILLEEGCSEFSNIVGLTQIRFPKGNIMAKSEEVRRVLEREGILK
ncbi:MAG TPA: TIR domain-containing protein [Gemmataceae bacterium]